MIEPSAGQAPFLVSVPSNPVPEGARVGMFLTRDGLSLRFAHWPRRGETHRGTICLVHGRTEFIEKYFETIEDFRTRGFAVATFDWRGQGLSERLLQRGRLGFVETADDYVTDLASFHAEVLLPDLPPPFYLVGHSMGALVSLLAAGKDRLMFDRLFLSAPMLGLDGLPFSPPVTQRVLGALDFLGLGRQPLSRPPDKPPSREGFEGNALTGDLTRYMRMVDCVVGEPRLLVGAPTIAWVAAALEGMASVRSDRFVRDLRVPVLMLVAASDTVVSRSATDDLALRLRTGHHLVVPGARHELFMETDAIRAQVFAAFDAFLTEQSA